MRPYYFDFDRHEARRARAIAMARPVAWHRWPPPRRDWLGNVVGLVRTWRARGRGRAELARLEQRMLRDIGVPPGEAARETDKPFWQP